ncbi:PA3496 family putative envelope integrity protein [Pseudomonas sp. NUPR-001]|uniref:PA3496 family putative envelope integrity protein n=1 Tax=Pseudomonas sp. NUPR-001 TaxID=3416058 RepID=UPI003F9883F1
MAREFDGSYQPTVKSRKQQEKDQRRMEFRRAIESYSEQRRLLQEIADYPDLQAISVWQVSAASSPKNAQQVR